ncbi:hypothetical protein ACFTAO_08300 [Paenibacillus rhizoplanae]
MPRRLNSPSGGISRVLEDAMQLLYKQSADRSLMKSFQFVRRCAKELFRQIEADLLHTAKQDTDRIKVSEITGVPLEQAVQILQEFRLSLSVLTSRHEREIDNTFEAVNGMIDLFQVLAGTEGNYLLWASQPPGRSYRQYLPQGD